MRVYVGWLSFGEWVYAPPPVIRATFFDMLEGYKSVFYISRDNRSYASSRLGKGVMIDVIEGRKTKTFNCCTYRSFL